MILTVGLWILVVVIGGDGVVIVVVVFLFLGKFHKATLRFVIIPVRSTTF